MYIHLIGIGGKGMSGIAIILHKQGFKITGSDNNKKRVGGGLHDIL